MLGSNASVPPAAFFLPRWARIAVACFMFAVSAVTMWDNFWRFNWAGFLCFGLYFLIHVPMQKGEASKAYFSKPRTILSFALVIAVMVVAMASLYHRFTN